MDGQGEDSIGNSATAENQGGARGSGGKEIREEDWVEQLKSAVSSNKSDEVKKLLKYREGKISNILGPESYPNKIFGNDGLIDALFTAIEENRSSLATHLIRAKGAKLGNKKQGNQNRSPLHEAVRMDNRVIVKELLKHSECFRYIDLGDELGRSALHEAAARGYLEIMSDLLNNKANVDVPDNSNMTPLHLTVWYTGGPNQMEVARTLLDSFGAEVNTKDKAGNTPLHDACEKGDHDMANLLLSHGADSGVRNADGKTPPDVIPKDYGANAVPREYEWKAPFNELEELRQLFKRPWGISERKTMAQIPGEQPVCPEHNRKVCSEASVYVRHYWRGSGQSWATSTSVKDLVYNERTLRDMSDQFNTIITQTRMPTIGEFSLPEGETWKWIHFSANNDLVWLITHSNNYDFAERSRVWGFWDRTTNDREGAGAGITRMPHVRSPSSAVYLCKVVLLTNITKSSWKKAGNKERRNASSPKASASLANNEIGSKIRDKKMMGSSWEKASNEERRDARLFPKKRSLSIVMPFIDFETEPYLERREVEKIGGHLRKMLDLFHLYSPYTGKDGLQIPKTLDESYYDMLSTERITARDRDQVVYKWFRDKANQPENKLGELFDYFSRYRTLRELREKTPVAGRSEVPPSELVTEQAIDADELATHDESNSHLNPAGEAQAETSYFQPSLEKDKATLDDIPVKKFDNTSTTGDVAKLLMVHQLWLWKLGDNTVITCCPDRCHTGAEDTLIDSIRQGGIESMHEPDDLIEHILYECATSLDKFRDAGLKAHVLDIFDNRIAKMSDDEVVHFKKFSDKMKEEMKSTKEKRKDANEKTKDEKEGGKRSSGRGRSITDEISLLYEVKDVRDELNLVRRVFEAQAGVLEKFSRLFWPGFEEQSKRCRESFLEDCGIKALIDRATRLDADAEKTLEALDYLVQVKQAQSSLDEAEAARLLNNYIVLFTIVTIIFVGLTVFNFTDFAILK
ncbi:hypothetical protein O1611_g6207 [Lasiodiplodia mahajangana]|uniref:Uncharacterized protein n=1 Tax=Lasiodiplodia mahajangana TaxID=1108764 RepID=A0ACC2JIW2_9PEZI|nr:hypothetical protein O1611_g6207 [Lasiodiplodia mahajangana]